MFRVACEWVPSRFRVTPSFLAAYSQDTRNRLGTGVGEERNKKRPQIGSAGAQIVCAFVHEGYLWVCYLSFVQRASYLATGRMF